MVSLIRIKDVKQRVWEEVWVKCYEQPSFLIHTKYLCKLMLVALATRYGTTGIPVVKSWIAGYSLDTPLKLTDDQATEATCRVHFAVEAISRVEKHLSDKKNNDEEEGEEDGFNWLTSGMLGGLGFKAASSVGSFRTLHVSVTWCFFYSKRPSLFIRGEERHAPREIV